MWLVGRVTLTSVWQSHFSLRNWIVLLQFASKSPINRFYLFNESCLLPFCHFPWKYSYNRNCPKLLPFKLFKITPLYLVYSLSFIRKLHFSHHVTAFGIRNVMVRYNFAQLEMVSMVAVLVLLSLLVNILLAYIAYLAW